MGADIHTYVERLDDDDNWVPVYTKLRKCSECDGTTRINARCENCKATPQDHDEVTKRCFTGPLTFVHGDDPCRYCAESWAPPGMEEDWQDSFYGDRNYELFGILADVRGSPDPKFTQAERGVPDDASENYQRAADCVDWHSHTWYTLEELDKYPFQKKFHNFQRGMERMRAIEPDPTRIRMLMFFDN